MKSLFLLIIATVPALSTSAQLANVSVRAVQTSAFDTRITFEIPEGAAQEILIREIGPTLSLFGIPDTLSDPAIELSRNGTIIATNDNWADSNADALRAAFFNRGVFSLASDARDSALLLTLDPGKYSLRSYSSTGTGDGAVLHEIYAGPAGLRSLGITQGSSDSATVFGFAALGGSYLVRALGPALGANGAADPNLQLFSNFTPAQNSDDWTASPEAVEIAEATARLGLPPLVAGSSDAALLLREVDPGVFTAIVRNDGAPGLSSVEIYDLSYNHPARAVPEPSTYGLFAVIATALIVIWRRVR